MSASRKERRGLKAALWAGVGVVGTLAGALAIVPQIDAAREWVLHWLERRGSVELEASYENEIWRGATSEQFAWLQDEWCYPSLRNFRSRFKVERGALFRQNDGGRPDAFQTDWVGTTVHISDRKVLRIGYVTKDWPVDFILYEPENTAEFREYQRYVADDGTVSSGDKRLVLSCTRCRLSRDGITYQC
jgi:hypothetical protein